MTTSDDIKSLADTFGAERYAAGQADQSQADQASIADLQNHLDAMTLDRDSWQKRYEDLLASQDPPPPPPPSSSVRFGYFDSFPLRVSSLGGASNYNSNAGVDKALQDAGGRGSQIMHTYPGKWETSYASSTVAKSAEFGNAFLVNMAAPGSYADIVAGKCDTQIKAWFNSVPITQVCYVTMDSEPDNSSKGTDPVAYCAAMAHVVNVAAPIYRSRGLKGGVGGLLMGYNFSVAADPKAVFSKWNWIAGVQKANLGQAVYMLDCYSKYLDAQAKTYESIPAIVEKAFSQARALGVSRFGIGEFANSRAWRGHSDQIVGTSATQQSWLRAELPKLRAISGLELAIMFAKPTGPESKFGELVDDATAKPFTEYALAI